MLIEIQNDVYFILNRIREIDSGYKIFYNTAKKHFEIHNSKQKGGSYCLTVPFNVLDERTVMLVRKSRVENFDQLIKDIDKHNDSLNKKMQDEIFKNLDKEFRKI